MSVRNMITATAVAVSLTLGAGAFAGVANAEATGGGEIGSSAAVSTRAFWITNMTGYDMRLDNVVNGGDNEELPAPGFIIKPFSTAQLERTTNAWETTSARLDFSFVDRQGGAVGSYKATLRLNSFGVRFSDAEVSGGDFRADAGGQNLIAMDRAGTVEVDADQLGVQEAVVGNICGRTDAQCTFVPERQEKEWTPPTLYDNMVTTNRGDKEATYAITVSKTTGVTQGFEVGASVETGAIINLFTKAVLNSKYSQSFTTSSTYSQTWNMRLDPGRSGWFTISTPVVRTYGTFTAKIGGTTYLLKNMSFTAPDKDRATHVEMVTAPAMEKITPAVG